MGALPAAPRPQTVSTVSRGSRRVLPPHRPLTASCRSTHFFQFFVLLLMVSLSATPTFGNQRILYASRLHNAVATACLYRKLHRLAKGMLPDRSAAIILLFFLRCVLFFFVRCVRGVGWLRLVVSKGQRFCYWLAWGRKIGRRDPVGDSGSGLNGCTIRSICDVATGEGCGSIWLLTKSRTNARTALVMLK